MREIAQILEQVKREQKSPVTASISKPYKGLDGIRRSYEEAQGLFEPICSSATNENTFSIPVKKEEKAAKVIVKRQDLRSSMLFGRMRLKS